MGPARLHRLARNLLARAEAEDLALRIQIRLNGRMRTCAGVCRYVRIRGDHVPRRFEIHLNRRLLVERHPEALLPTLAHELAHAVVRARHGRRAAAHGREWRAVMEAMGFEPDPYHDLDVSDLRRTFPPGGTFACRRCHFVHRLGPIQTRRELTRPGTYRCRCGGELRLRRAGESGLFAE